MVSSGDTAILGNLLLRGLGFGVAGSGLRRTPGLAPNDPKEEAARLVLFTVFLGGVDRGE